MLRAWGTTAFFIAAILIGALPLWPIYQSPQLLVTVIGGAVGGALIAILGFRFRWAGIVVLLATAAFWLVAGVALALPGRALGGVLPTPQGLLELVRGTVLGWKQLLTISLPVGDYQNLLVPAFVLILVASVVGLSVALRSPQPAWGFCAPAAVMIAGIALGDWRSFLPLATSLGLLVVVLGWHLWHRRVRDSGLPRRILGGTLVLMLSIGGALALVGAVPGAGQRAVVRDAVLQPFDSRSQPSALSGYRAYLSPASRDLVMLEVTGLPEGGRLSIARLDAYDGVVAGLGESVFQRVPVSIDQSMAAGTPVSLGVRIDAYRGVWVPGVGPLESIEFSGPGAEAFANGFFYDPASETMALAAGGLGQNDGYRLDAVLPQMLSTPLVADLVPGADPVTQTTGVPAELEDFLLASAPATSSPGARLSAALEALATSGYVSHGIGAAEPFSRSGHGADRLAQLFTAVPMLGDSEQYAVAAALMANRLGFPARVVVGFAPTGQSSGLTLVRGSDIAAWIEVETATSGWVGIDPTPDTRPVPAAVPEDATAANRPPVILPPAVEAAPDTAATVPLANQDDEATAQPDRFWEILWQILGIAGLSLALLTLVLGPFAAIVLAKARRRTRRQTGGTARDRARGAWQEYLDARADSGQPAVKSDTRLETAEAIGGHALFLLATACDRAAYAPVPPMDREVELLWRESAALRRDLHLGLRPVTRINAWVSPRTLPAYHWIQRLRNRSIRQIQSLLPGSGPRVAQGQSGAARE